MSLVSSFYRLTSLGVKRVTRIFGDDGGGEESHPRRADGSLFMPVEGDAESSRLVRSSTRRDDESSQQQHSLTSAYEEFSHSSKALWIFFFHAIIYYGLSVAGFSFFVEHWSVTDSLYYATVLFCTIGFGDVAPDNLKGRIFTIFLAFYGIVVSGIFLGVLGEYLVAKHSEALERRRRKVGTQVVQNLKNDMNVIQAEQINFSSTNESARERTLWEDVWSVAVSETPILVFLLFVGLGVGYVEGWSTIDSIYWLVISGTTIGLGDYHPNLTYVKLFCVVFLPFAVAVVGELLGRIASVYMDRKRHLAEKRFLSRSLTLCDLETMDTDHDGRVDKAEFLSYMLVSLQKVSKEDVREVLDLFHKLDVDGSNFLTKNDLMAKNWNTAFRSSFEQSMEFE